MKLVSWNVNGLRAVIRKEFADQVREIDPDVLCLQEIKSLEEQVDFDFGDYYVYWNSAERKGYSGTLTMTKTEPLRVTTGVGDERFDCEGRVLTLEFEDFFLVNVYTPNAKAKLERLDERMEFEDLLRNYLNELKKEKSVILCGDLNVAHEEIDLANPKSNRGKTGFTDEERGKFTELLGSNFVDTFRHFYPEERDAYTWWSYKTRARSRNVGWRIDYFVVSDDMVNRIKGAEILSDIMGSDHCPVVLYI